MGNHDVGRAFAAAADVFWQFYPGATPSKREALDALRHVAERFPASDAEFDDELIDHTTPLGRLVAIAFDATERELAEPDRWDEGPVDRFRSHFGLR